MQASATRQAPQRSEICNGWCLCLSFSHGRQVGGSETEDTLPQQISELLAAPPQALRLAPAFESLPHIKASGLLERWPTFQAARITTFQIKIGHVSPNLFLKFRPVLLIRCNEQSDEIKEASQSKSADGLSPVSGNRPEAAAGSLAELAATVTAGDDRISHAARGCPQIAPIIAFRAIFHFHWTAT